MLSDKKIAYDHFLIISEPPPHHHSQHKDPIVRRYSVLILVAFQLNTNVTSAFLHVPSTPPLHNHKLYRSRMSPFPQTERPHTPKQHYIPQKGTPPRTLLPLLSMCPLGWGPPLDSTRMHTSCRSDRVPWDDR